MASIGSTKTSRVGRQLPQRAQHLDATRVGGLRRGEVAVGRGDELEVRNRRVDEQLLEANQRRQDVGKHIDELIAQIDQLDAQFESQEEM